MMKSCGTSTTDQLPSSYTLANGPSVTGGVGGKGPGDGGDGVGFGPGGDGGGDGAGSTR